MELNHSLSRVLGLLYLWSHAHLLIELVKRKTFYLLLKIGAYFTTHGFLFKAETYKFLECSTHGSNPQEPLLSLQMISIALHGSSFHRAAVYISDRVECIVILPKWKTPPDIFTKRFSEKKFTYLRSLLGVSS